jgi:hypothetical protein
MMETVDERKGIGIVTQTTTDFFQLCTLKIQQLVISTPPVRIHIYFESIVQWRRSTSELVLISDRRPSGMSAAVIHHSYLGRS